MTGPTATDALVGAAPGVRMLAIGGDEAADVLRLIREWAHDVGLDLEVALDAPRGTRSLASSERDVVLVVLGDRPEDDLEWWVNALRVVGGRTRLLALAPHPSMGLVLHAANLGVLDVLSLPPRREDFLRAVQRVRSAAVEEPVALPVPDVQPDGPYALVGTSPAMLVVYRAVAQVAPSSATVLLLGESGTGKEVVARTIHRNGQRASGPFVAVNCAAIPENLLESELFGHERGAFTGAVARKIGRFEHAAGGTLFLDEIADMSLALQAKILRAVQEREIERVGGLEPIPINVRVIAATHRNLQETIAQGQFREDLFFRLAVVTIRLPPLADRAEDLPLLIAYFIREFAGRYHKAVTTISDRALDLLRHHVWVGNVRELRNVIERAVIMATGETLCVEHLPDELRGEQGALPERADGGLMTIAEVEARHIARVLAHTHGQISTAAEILGIHRNTLTRKMKTYGL
jgi:DNA-binding NtrC family response regulator